MTQSPRFALSIPVKTGIAYLPFALRSLECQTPPLEVALLDASGDAVVRALSDRHERMIRFRRHASKDAGQSAAIQEGWDHISGDILGWLNADDVLLPGALEAVTAVFTENPEVDVVYGHAVYLGANWEFQTYFPSLSRDPSVLCRINIICQPACFVRRSAVSRVGGLDASLRFTMDWDLWLRLYEAGCRFHFLAKPLAAVINHGDTKTNTGGEARYGEIDRTLRRYAGLRTRFAAQVGHRRTDAASMDGRIGRMAEAAMRLAGVLLPRRRPETVFGIEPESNRVDGRCRITMPWYRDLPPRAVCLRATPDNSIQVSCNGTALPLTAEPSTGGWTASIPPSPSALYDFEMEGPRRWRLRELRLLA